MKRAKSSSLSSTSNRAPKAARKDVKQAIQRDMPAVAAAAYSNNLMANTIDPARSVPMAYPDANNPFTHCVHHKLVENFSATVDNTDFTFVVKPDPEAMLNAYVEGQVGISSVSGTALFAPGVNPSTGGSYWISGTAGRDADYGRLPADTNSVPIITALQQDGNQAMVLVTNAGTEIRSVNNGGAFDLNPSLANTAITLTMGWTVVAYGVAATFTFSLQSSVDTVNWTVRGTVSPTEVTGQTSVAGAANTDRYYRVLLSTSVGSTPANPRYTTNMSLTFASSLSIFPPSLRPYPIQSLNTLQSGTKAFRCIGLTVLVTNMSSDLANGGQICGVQLGSDYAQTDGFPDYGLISRLPNAYNGPFKKGTFGFWSPESTVDMGFVPWSEDDPSSLPFLVVAGSFATIGGALRVQVDAVFEYVTENEAFGPTPSRTAVWEIEARAQVLSQVTCHFCENPLHPKLQALFKKAASMYDSAKPYIAKGMTIAKTLAPLLPLLL